MQKLNRRQFIAGAAVAGAAVAAEAGVALAEEATAGEQWDLEADVVIVGAGGGGLAAAVEAAQAGAQTLVLEVMGTYLASNSAICGAMIQGACTRTQQAEGIEDTIEGFDAYLTACFEGIEKPELRQVLAQKAGESIDWLTDLGVNFKMCGTNVSNVDYYADVTPAVARVHMAEGGGVAWSDAMYNAAVDAGAEFAFDTQATKLVTDASGAVVGVEALQEGEPVRVHARKAVILNSGGFTRNAQMVRDYLTLPLPGTPVTSIRSYGSHWQQGDGIRMGQAVGAKLTNMWLCYEVGIGVAGDDATNHGDHLGVGYTKPGIYVSTDGKRHVREGKGRPVEMQIAEIWSQPGGFVWAVFDQPVVDGGGVGYPTFSATLEDEVAAGYFLKANSLDELAALMEVDADALAETVDTWNTNCAAGSDPDLGRDSNLVAIETAPFYACKVVAATPDTAGGLDINAQAQVLDCDGNPIAGLYAVGNTTGGWKGRINAGCGCAMANTITFGRIAGQQAAAL